MRLLRYIFLVAVFSGIMGCGSSDSSSSSQPDGFNPSDSDVSGELDGLGDGQTPNDMITNQDGSEIPTTPCNDNAQCAPSEVCNTVKGYCQERCFSAATCPEGHDCDLATGICHETAECQTDSDCGAFANVCNCYGSCAYQPSTKPCQRDQNCSYGEYCDACTQTCKTQLKACDPCDPNPTLTTQCEKKGSLCLPYSSGGYWCGLRCSKNTDCPAGYSCEPVGSDQQDQCIPVSGTCAQIGFCDKDSDCPYGKICSDTAKVCTDGCSSDGQCNTEAGQVCSAFRCQNKCDPVTNPCEGNQECDEGGHCILSGGCMTSADCPEKETYCDTDSNQCVPGCEVDSDCKEYKKKCENGHCVDKGCPGNYWCAFENVCNLQTGICEPYEGPLCDECTEDSGQKGCGGSDDNLCLELQDEDGNSLGKFCFIPCSSDPDNLCPQGYQCLDLGAATEGQISGSYCFRACHVPPVGG